MPRTWVEKVQDSDFVIFLRMWPNWKKLSEIKPPLKIIREKVVPAFHLFGHIHEDYGIWTEGQTTFINAAFAGPWKGYPKHSWTNKTAIVFDIPITKDLK